MLLTIVYTVLPALVIITTLFGLLARGDPKPGGVALFGRVGVVALVLGVAVFYLVEYTGLLGGARPAAVVGGYRGLVGGGLVLVLMAAFGSLLKKPR